MHDQRGSSCATINNGEIWTNKSHATQLQLGSHRGIMAMRCSVVVARLVLEEWRTQTKDDGGQSAHGRRRGLALALDALAKAGSRPPQYTSATKAPQHALKGE